MARKTAEQKLKEIAKRMRWEWTEGVSVLAMGRNASVTIAIRQCYDGARPPLRYLRRLAKVVGEVDGED